MRPIYITVNDMLSRHGQATVKSFSFRKPFPKKKRAKPLACTISETLMESHCFECDN